MKYMAIYYCSDHHFYHKLMWNSVKISGISEVDEINKELVRRHNLKVQPEDTVYFLGDVIFCKAGLLSSYMEETVGQMNGHKRLILGNHDYRNAQRAEFTKYFETIREAETINDSDEIVHLFHYPILSWWNKQRGSYHIHGHLHGNRNCQEFKVLRLEERALSACLEINNYEPCTLEEVIYNNKQWKHEIDTEECL